MRDRLTSLHGEGPTPEERDASNLYHLPLLAASRSPSWRRDLGLLFVLPGVALTLVFLLGDPITFEYRIANPTLWGIYMSNLAHRSWQHLLANMGGFILIAGSEYLLLTAVGYRRHYIGVFLGSLLVFPLISHLFLQFVGLQQPVFETYEAVGFSEPLAALAGYLPLCIATYLSTVRELRWPIWVALVLYAGGLAWAMGHIFGGTAPTLAIGAIGIAGVGWIGFHLSHGTDAKQSRFQSGVTVLILLLIYMAALQGLFPGKNVGSMVGHLAGFLPGFFLPMIVIWVFSLLRPAHSQAINLE